MSAKAKKKPEPEVARVVPLPSRRAGLFVVTALSCDDDHRRARVELSNGEHADARLAAALDPAVVQTAIARKEVLIAQDEDGAIVLLGALRTAATPGLEKGDEYVLEAKRLKIVGEHSLALRAGATQLVLRAVGLVETIARDITSRAAGVHKIVGRMIHLN